ncbi:furin-1-like [Mya arenaria]|uniref:furin-1-like n=1 Tax=Mya arenaria TaxID=6604 RepID=UPI0022E317C7|nr:furin-1-like [Mya arenaria]
MSRYPDVASKSLSRLSPQIGQLTQLQYRNHSLRAAGRRQSRDIQIDDAAWPNMWHAREDQFPNLGVYESWLQGYTGAGVHVSVLDDGIEPDHPDLIANYDSAGSYDYIYDTPFVNHTETDYHGTWCAGIISATKNNDCVLGMAYDSKLSSVKIFDSYYGLTDFGESQALTHNLAQTDIYSNSWGPFDSGDIMEGPGPLATEALKRAITEGRNGKGAIYTWAAGNGGIYDDCGCDGYAGSIYTISVTAVGRDQGPSWYSEECSSVFVGAYSGDSPDLRIWTTDTGGMCTGSFQGTSASCPVGAGVIALALQANPDLTWRDVQHLIVATASTSGLIGANWQLNGAGIYVSHVFGFGLINAEAMVREAMTWTNVSPQRTCTSDVIVVNSMSARGEYVTSSHVTNGCGQVTYVEHVEVWLSYEATYRGSVQITLTSPRGTRSRLIRPRRFDVYNGTTEWTFMTIMSWGELAAGEWTLQLETLDVTTDFGINSWQLIMYGTETAASYADPQVSPETDDTDGGAIAGGVVGGLAVVAIAAVAIAYLVISKKARPPTVKPATSNGGGVDNPVMNTRYPGNGVIAEEE